MKRVFWNALRPPAELFRTAPFRLTLGLVCVIVLGMGLQLGLLCWQMNAFDQHRTSEILQGAAEMLAQETPRELEVTLHDRSTNELRVLLNGAGLFDLQHHHVGGDIRRWPPGLQAPPPGPVSFRALKVQPLTVTLPDGTETAMRFLVVRVKGVDGQPRLLVVERSRHTADELRRMARKTAMYSVLPVALFALLAGLFLSQRTLVHIKVIHEALERIMKGDLHERFPLGSGRDDFQLLARSVNRMLDRLQHLMEDMRDVGNSIAHDLRTPLARVQARLDRAVALQQQVLARHYAQGGDQSLSGPELSLESPASSSLVQVPAGQLEKVEEALLRCRADLEQCFSVITSLLRIGEIESGQRRAGFDTMDLAPLVAAMADLYEPMAETKGITLSLQPAEGPTFSGPPVSGRSQAVLPLVGDADLLNEVLANLLDNALKFTPAGGKVVIRSGQNAQGESWFEIGDTGPGIPPEEREAVLGRFYRADKSRHIPGSGLGLSLVAAIVRLHEARLEIGDGPAWKVQPPSSSGTGTPEASEDGVPRGTVFRLLFPPLR
ncbi:sensor histidine kinase [Oecophyllibacter saccharovorans]|uniref:sensor histidine kinase n=1 Tax=Oecophyllibacter saccharovorans TaxID=2558360 RepID=UPI001E3C381C|nr:HAMP domain-containing sensor histidine kinase [Oecophyllibacter saccharovorans]